MAFKAMSKHGTWRSYLFTGVLTLCVAACSNPAKKQGEPQAETKPSAQAEPAKDKEEAQPAKPADPLKAAIAHPDRPAEDKARDADRKPYEVLSFFGIKPGMKVAELMTGTGYYAELLGRAVGAEGRVYAQNNDFVVNRFDMSALDARTKQLSHVTHLKAELDELGLPEGELDAVLMVLFYHDTYWMDVDRAKMNKQIFDALKPGGVYGIVDHFAEDGSGERDVKSLHRGDAEMIKKDILAAGFEFDGESDVLRHPEDERKASVFDDGMRGKTDRFIYRFRKPAE